MRHLPSTTRVLTMQVNNDTTSAPSAGVRVLAVGRFVRPTCEDCDGFESVKVVIGGELVTIDCTACTAPSPTAGVIDDVHDEDEAEGYEAEDVLVQGRAA